MEIFFIEKGELNPMKRMKDPGNLLKKGSRIKPKMNQFNHFWEVECPECGVKIDLEVLVNQLKNKKN